MKARRIVFFALALTVAFQSATGDVLSYASNLSAFSTVIGTTYSHRQSQYFEIDGKETYLPVVEMGFNLVRLAAYWDEIEREEGRFDFTTLDWEIEQARQHHVPIVLEVGMKAPRWPEFFIPAWVMKKTRAPYGAELSGHNGYLKQRTLIFIGEVVKRYRNEPSVRYWQVENEPLDRSGDNFWWVDKSFVKEEAAIVRGLDGRRPILMTVATYPNRFVRSMFKLFSLNHPIPETMALGDIVGINVYHAIGQKICGFKFYFWIHPEERAQYYSRILKLARKHHKEIWITELQAEPWEPGAVVYKGKELPPSGMPGDSEEVFNEFRTLGFRTIFLWGSEYWQYRKLRYDDSQWSRMVEGLLKRKAQGPLSESSSWITQSGTMS